MKDPIKFIMSIKSNSSYRYSPPGYFNLITITDQKSKPEELLLKYYDNEDPPKVFQSEYTPEELEKKRQQSINKTKAKIDSEQHDMFSLEIDREKELLDYLNRLKKMSLEEYAEMSGDVYDKKTNSFGFYHNPNARFNGFRLGKETIPTLNGQMVNQAKYKDIDWKMLNAPKVTHLVAFFDKSGNYYREFEMPIGLFQKAWEKAINESRPEDIFTHWDVSYVF